MGLLETMALFNIITLLNTVFPKGIGEMIVLFAWFACFGELAIIVVTWALTKELTYVNAIARVGMQDIGITIYPGGGSREHLLSRTAETYKEKIGESDALWTINDKEFQTKSNGVRYTFFYPGLPTNMSFNHLVNMLNSSVTQKLDEYGNVTYVPITNVSYSAFHQDRKVSTLAQAMAADIENPLTQFGKFAPWIAIIFTITICAVIIFLMFPHNTTQVVEAATTTTQTTVTTLAPTISRIRPPV